MLQCNMNFVGAVQRGIEHKRRGEALKAGKQALSRCGA
jgi:hypothetical protein